MDSSDKDNDKEDSNEFHFDNFLQARSIGFWFAIWALNTAPLQMEGFK
jgi:hypothetical protein